MKDRVSLLLFLLAWLASVHSEGVYLCGFDSSSNCELNGTYQCALITLNTCSLFEYGSQKISVKITNTSTSIYTMTAFFDSGCSVSAVSKPDIAPQTCTLISLGTSSIKISIFESCPDCHVFNSSDCLTSTSVAVTGHHLPLNTSVSSLISSANVSSVIIVCLDSNCQSVLLHDSILLASGVYSLYYNATDKAGIAGICSFSLTIYSIDVPFCSDLAPLSNLNLPSTSNMSAYNVSFQININPSPANFNFSMALRFVFDLSVNTTNSSAFGGSFDPLSVDSHAQLVVWENSTIEKNVTLSTSLPLGLHAVRSSFYSTLFTQFLDFGSCLSFVHVFDVTPPIIRCPSFLSSTTDTNQSTGVLTISPSQFSISDNSGAFNASFDPNSEFHFPIGITNATATASDSSNNTATCSFRVRILDTQPPIFLNCPNTNITVLNSSSSFPRDTVVTWPIISVQDNSGGNVAISESAHRGSLFPVGVTEVVINATDSSNNVAQCRFLVVVQAPPAIVQQSSKTLALVVGEPAALTCEVEAYPVPLVSLTRNKLPFPYLKSNASIKGELTIASVNQSFAGMYVFLFSNSFGSVQSTTITALIENTLESCSAFSSGDPWGVERHDSTRASSSSYDSSRVRSPYRVLDAYTLPTVQSLSEAAGSTLPGALASSTYSSLVSDESNALYSTIGNLAVKFNVAQSKMDFSYIIASFLWATPFNLSAKLVFESSPSYYENSVYVISTSGLLVSLNADSGLPQWSVNTGITNSYEPVFVDSSKVKSVFVASASMIKGFSLAEGSSTLNFSSASLGSGVDFQISTPLTIDTAGESMFFGTSGGYLIRLFISNVSVIWKSALADQSFLFAPIYSIVPFPFSSSQKLVFVVTANNNLLAVEVTFGNLFWGVAVNHTVFSLSVDSSLGLAYITTSDSQVVSVTLQNGHTFWESEILSGSLATTPAIGSDNVVYVVSSNCTLHALDPDFGALKWSLDLPSAAEFHLVSTDMLSNQSAATTTTTTITTLTSNTTTTTSSSTTSTTTTTITSTSTTSSTITTASTSSAVYRCTMSPSIGAYGSRVFVSAQSSISGLASSSLLFSVSACLEVLSPIQISTGVGKVSFLALVPRISPAVLTSVSLQLPPNMNLTATSKTQSDFVTSAYVIDVSGVVPATPYQFRTLIATNFGPGVYSPTYDFIALASTPTFDTRISGRILVENVAYSAFDYPAKIFIGSLLCRGLMNASMVSCSVSEIASLRNATRRSYGPLSFTHRSVSSFSVALVYDILTFSFLAANVSHAVSAKVVSSDFANSLKVLGDPWQEASVVEKDSPSSSSIDSKSDSNLLYYAIAAGGAFLLVIFIIVCLALCLRPKGKQVITREGARKSNYDRSWYGVFDGYVGKGVIDSWELFTQEFSFQNNGRTKETSINTLGRDDDDESYPEVAPHPVRTVPPMLDQRPSLRSNVGPPQNSIEMERLGSANHQSYPNPFGGHPGLPQSTSPAPPPPGVSYPSFNPKQPSHHRDETMFTNPVFGQHSEAHPSFPSSSTPRRPEPVPLTYGGDPRVAAQGPRGPFNPPHAHQQQQQQQAPVNPFRTGVPNPMGVPEQFLRGPSHIPLSQIQIISHLNSGNFGDVYSANLITGNNIINVAIKSVKLSADIVQNEANMAEFNREFQIMMTLSHPNVVKMYGICLEGALPMIVLEFMPLGSLLQFLKSNHDLPTVFLINICAQVSSGMEYLSSKGIIHRDLAARNCLVDEGPIIKISDFGLSRLVGQGEYYVSTSDSALPLRWCAPEAIMLRKYTSQSDVWSFGILLWEVMTRCKELPYAEMNIEDTIAAIERGYRLQKPYGCPDPLYTLMLLCWKDDKLERPHFGDITSSLMSIYDSCLSSEPLYQNTSVSKGRPQTRSQGSSSSDTFNDHSNSASQTHLSHNNNGVGGVPYINHNVRGQHGFDFHA